MAVPPASHRSPALSTWHRLLLFLSLIGLLFAIWPKTEPFRSQFQTDPSAEIAPLAMAGGNPYLRALMRTISASEANDPNPYTLLYGGEHIRDLSSHPDRCIEIVAGPNQGLCTTAAGRYQFLTTTWEEKAQQYHPNPSGWLWWRQYSFAPEYQDQVVYRWLNDFNAWNTDIPALLEAGQLPAVLERLSGTWTSLGYGIEDNVMTPFLEDIYHSLLAEELGQIAQIP